MNPLRFSRRDALKSTVAGFGYLADDEIAAGEFAGVLERDKVGFFFNDHDRAMIAVRIAADVAKTFTVGRWLVLVDEKTTLADFNIAQFIDAHGEIVHSFFLLPDQIEGEPDRLARSDGWQFRKLVRNAFNGRRKFHGLIVP